MRSQGLAVIRPLYLGDLLCAVPALRALRSAVPDVPITLIGLPWAAEFARRFDRYIDGFLPFPGWPGIPEREPTRAALCSFYTSIRDLQFDLVIQAHGDGSVMNGFAASLPTTATAGFNPSDSKPRSPLFMPYPTHLREPERLLALIDHLGFPTQGADLEFPVRDRDRAEAMALLKQCVSQVQLTERYRDYVVIHPGSRGEDRRWPPECFALVAGDLAARGLLPVLTGSEREREITERVRSAMRCPSVDLTGQTSLGALAALIEGARLLVCNDTGVSHIAAATRTPSVVIFTGSDPARWAPLDGARHRALGSGNGATVPSVATVIEASRDLVGVAV